MNKIRVTSICFVAALALPSLPARAEGPGSSLAARMAALEARVAKLESGQVEAADLVGTYAVNVFAVDLLGNPARVRNETSSFTVTLNANGTASFAGTGADCTLQQGAPWFVTCNQEGGAGTGTWTVKDGSLEIHDENGEDVINDPNFIGAGGRVIISGGTSFGETPTEGYSVIMIMIRLPNP